MSEEPTEQITAAGSDAELDVESFLDDLGFGSESMYLTRRQVVVLALRERGHDQARIADRLDCSRANVSNIERSARQNIEKARATISFAELLSAPVRVELPAGLPIHKIPERIYQSCDDEGVKVQYGAPELIDQIATTVTDGDDTGTLPTPVVVMVTPEGEVRVLRDE